MFSTPETSVHVLDKNREISPRPNSIQISLTDNPDLTIFPSLGQPLERRSEPIIIDF